MVKKNRYNFENDYHQLACLDVRIAIVLSCQRL